MPITNSSIIDITPEESNGNIIAEHQDFIKNICKVSAKPLNDGALTGSDHYRSFLIDCEKLSDFDEINIYEDAIQKLMFDELLKFKCPILYWFEIISPTSNKQILDALIVYKNKEGRKSIPAIRKSPPLDTNVLYVGKVVKGFSGRVVTHLGYYKVSRTQGLQLFHWALPIKLKLRLHMHAFKPEMGRLMAVIERAMAEKLRPLLGKHS